MRRRVVDSCEPGVRRFGLLVEAIQGPSDPVRIGLVERLSDFSWYSCHGPILAARDYCRISEPDPHKPPLDALAPIGAPEALVPFDHPAHHGGAEAHCRARGPSQPVLWPRQIGTHGTGRPHLPAIIAQRIIVTPRLVDGRCGRASSWCRCLGGIAPDRQHRQAALAPATHAHPPLTPATIPSHRNSLVPSVHSAHHGVAEAPFWGARPAL